MIPERKEFYFLKEEKEENPDFFVEPWKIEDLRPVSVETLLSRLEDEGVGVDRQEFISWINEEESPETLTLAFADKGDLEKIYPLVFELWRKLVPEKMTLSLFADELDYQITLYNKEQPDDELLFDAVQNLGRIIDENVDQGEDPSAVFDAIQDHTAEELELFLFDYIFDLIDEEDLDDAEELIETFEGVVHEREWFEILKFRLAAKGDDFDAKREEERLVNLALKSERLEFVFEVMGVLVEAGSPSKFEKVLSHGVSLVRTEEEFQRLLEIALDFYSAIDREGKEKRIADILSGRSAKSLDLPFDQKDRDISKLLS